MFFEITTFKTGENETLARQNGNFSKQKLNIFMTGGIINSFICQNFFRFLSKTVVKDRLEKERKMEEAREEAERKKEPTLTSETY